MKNKKSNLLFLMGILLLFRFIGSEKTDNTITVPDYNAETLYVQDGNKIIDDDTKEKITKLGEQLYKEKGIRFVVHTRDAIGNKIIEEYANEVFNTWNLGNKGLLLVLSTNNRNGLLEVGEEIEEEEIDKISNKNFLYRNSDSEGIYNLYEEITFKFYSNGEKNNSGHDSEDKLMLFVLTIFLIHPVLILINVFSTIITSIKNNLSKRKKKKQNNLSGNKKKNKNKNKKKKKNRKKK